MFLLFFSCTDSPAPVDTAPPPTDTGPADTDPPDTTPPEDTGPVDSDGDGWLADEDCNDSDDSVWPGAEEVAYDGIDQDCDGADLTDLDGDGWDAQEAGGEDCDDTNPDISPGASEIAANGLDEDCDGYVDWDGMNGWQADLFWYGDEYPEDGMWLGMHGLAVIDDIDGDGGEDLLGATYLGAAVFPSSILGTIDTAHHEDTWVFLSPGEDTFWQSYGPRTLAPRGQDIDGDGAADIAMMTGAVVVFPHSLIAEAPGDGNTLIGDSPLLTIEQVREEGTFYSNQLIWDRDFDGDGLIDMVFGQYDVNNAQDENTGLISVFSGEALVEGAALLDTDADWTVEGSRTSIRFGQQVYGLPDLDGDGYDELFVSGDSSSALLSGALLTQTGLQTVDDAAFTILEHGDTDDVHAALSPGDLDGDGRGDVLLFDNLDYLEVDGFYPNGRLGVFLNLLDGGSIDWTDANANVYSATGSITGMTGPVDFGAGDSLLVTGAHGLGFVPLDQLPTTGHLDLNNWHNSIRYEDPDTGETARSYYEPDYGFGLFTPDLNGDGFPDLVAGNHEVSEDFVWQGEGSLDYDKGMVSIFINPL
ncbi:MAG: hypothetical protein ACI8RZ_001486 [Myxococcota bacterium]|jgi:hypothetical protein